MKKILGSLLLFSLTILNASLILKAPAAFVSGDEVVFSIEAKGEDIEFPNISTIDGYILKKTGTSNQISIINNKRTQRIIQRYIFYPTSSVTIPKLKIIIDGKEKFTNPHKIVMKKVKKTRSKFFDLTIKANKNSGYVGEDIILTLIFKYSRYANIVDLDFYEPNFDGFWSKQLRDPKKYDEGEFVVQELQYLLFPQKSGSLTINPLKIDVSIIDNSNNTYSFFKQASKKTRVYSNELLFNIKSLPDNVYLIGDFKISAKVNKTKINEGDSVSFQVNIDGRGNIDDMELPKLEIAGATIYENKPVKKYNIENGIYGGSYNKSYSIVSNSDFTIPKISIKYFDKKSAGIKTLKTSEFNINVNTNKKNLDESKLQLQKEEIIQKPIKQQIIKKVIYTSDNQKIIFFILGIVAGFLIIWLVFLFRNRNHNKEKNDLPIVKAVKRTSTKSELLKVLVPYVSMDKDLDKAIFELEKSDSLEFKNIKKEIVNVLLKLT